MYSRAGQRKKTPLELFTDLHHATEGPMMSHTGEQYVLTFLLMFAIGIGVPISPLLATKLGATWVEIGLMGSAWGLIFTFSAFLTGRVSDKLGRKPLLAVSSGLSALSALLFLQASSVSQLIAIRGLEGLAWACFWPTMEALATETAEADKMGRSIGLVTTAYAVAFLTGSFVGGYVASFFGFEFAFATYFVFASLSVIAVWFVRVPDHVEVLRPIPLRELMSRLLSRTVVAGNVLGGFYTFGLGTIMALLSVYAAGLGIPVFWIGAVFSLFWAGRIVGAALAGGASDRLGRSRVAQLALIIGCLGLLMVGLASDLSVLSVGVLLAGLSIGAVFPVNVAIIAGGIEPELRGAAMGFYEMMCAIGFMIASALGGVLAESMSPGTPYVLSAFVFLSCAVVLSILLPHRSQKIIRNSDPMSH